MLWSILRNPELSLRAISVWGFLGALGIGLTANALVSVLFSDLVAKLAPSVPLRRRLASYYYSQLAKYIPGRIAALLVQSATLGTPRSMAVTLVTSIELMAIGTWTCSIAAVFCALMKSHAALALIVGVGGALITAWLIRIDWRPAMRIGWRLFGRSFEGEALAVSKRPTLTRALMLGAGSIVLPAASMFVLVAYGFSFGIERTLSLTSALLLSWVGGTIAVIFPAGIGIRELLFIGMGRLIETAPPAEQMAAIALLSRLVQVLTDLLGVLGFAALDFLYRKTTGSSIR